MNYIEEKNISFCMPGHRSGLGFLETEEGRLLYNNIIKADITEVEGVDNLHNPQGIIKDAQILLSEYYQSKKSYFLVNGSTSGNLAMIFSCFDEGDKIIVERNCHRSILNAVILRKLTPIYINNNVNKKYNAPLSIKEEYLIDIIRDNEDAKGIITTYPNYYGVCLDLKPIIKEAHRNEMYVLVDSAHGAHFGVCDKLPKSAVMVGADMVVTSSHKTLPSFTQTAYLHLNKQELIEKVDFYVSSFSSTSPSYMLMCSMDYARFYLQTRGAEDYNQLIKLSNKYRDKINKIHGIHVIGKEDLVGQAYCIDPTRYVINIEEGYSAELLNKYLRENNIQTEMCDNQNIILILSPFNKEDHFNFLYSTLKKCNLQEFENEYYDLLNSELPEIRFLPYEILTKEVKSVELTHSNGEICAEAIVPYPPGVPLIMPGEVISKNIIEMINYYLRYNNPVMGIIKDDTVYRIKIVKGKEIS